MRYLDAVKWNRGSPSPVDEAILRAPLAPSATRLGYLGTVLEHVGPLVATSKPPG
jgi:hypothetical protein